MRTPKVPPLPIPRRKGYRIEAVIGNGLANVACVYLQWIDEGTGQFKSYLTYGQVRRYLLAKGMEIPDVG